MSRTLSTASLVSMFSQDTTVVWITLLTLDHDNLADPIRVCDNSEDTVSNGNTFQPFPFDIKLPSEKDDELPQVQLTISAIDRSVVNALRSLITPPTVTLEIVNDSDLDDVEIGPVEMELKSANYDPIIVTGQLAFEDILNEPFPYAKFTPNLFPGLF